MAAAAPATSAPARSEDILSAKTDLCLSNGIVKAGTGLAVGIVASALLFRRRPWPVFLGLGFGIGQGYSDCERVFNPAAVPGFKIAGEQTASPFTLSSPFTSVVSPSQTSAVPPAAPSPAPSASPSLSSAAQSVQSKVAAAVTEAKQKASDLAQAGQEKAAQAKSVIGDKVGQVEKKTEEEVVDPLKEGKKWV